MSGTASKTEMLPHLVVEVGHVLVATPFSLHVAVETSNERSSKISKVFESF